MHDYCFNTSSRTSLKTFSLRCLPISSTISSVTVDAMHKCHHEYDNLESTCNQSRQILSITLNCKSMISKIEERKLKHGFKDKCHFFHSELREYWHFIRKAFWCSLNLRILKFNLIATIISTMTQSKVINKHIYINTLNAVYHFHANYQLILILIQPQVINQ